MKKLITRDEYMRQEEARERIAIGLILYKDLQTSNGKDWIEAATEAIHVSEIMGVKDEYDKWLPKIPKMKPIEY